MTHAATNFNDLGLSEPLLKALTEMNFHSPSPIQAQTIPHMLAGKDIIGMAQTGTGKTAAFALPLLQKLKPGKTNTQALILAPTRELAIQVAEQCTALSRHLPGVTVAVLCGGQEYSRQLQQLKKGAQIVVGTPGRILDHIDRGTLVLNQLSTFVLDEGDEMLRMGFIEDVETILSKLPENKQMALFSATMPHRIRQIANQYLTEAVSVEIKSETATVKSTEQRFLFASHSQKPDALLRILAVEDYQGVIVFVRTKTATEEVATTLQQQGLRAMAIHGDITQALRERIIAQFKQGVIDILVATDVAARGLDVDRVTHVVNYDVPQDPETYVHRIGRTGRAGRSGVTILFVTPKESRILSLIERHTRQKIDKVVVPNDYQIQQVKLERFMQSISQRLEHEHLQAYQKIINQYLQDNQADPAQVAAVLALMLNQDKPWRQQLPPAKPAARFEEAGERRKAGGSFKSGGSFKERDRADRGKTFGNDVDQELFRIDIGRVHGVKPGNIVGAIANEGGLNSRHITNLKIHEDHCTVRLPKGMPRETVQSLTKAWVCGRPMKLTRIG